MDETRWQATMPRLRMTWTYMHRRYYRSIVGRYLSPDPVLAIEAAKQRPLMWNRYAYGIGSPLKWVDPTGQVIE